MNYYLKSRHIYKCSNPDCRRQFSVTLGTIFERTKLPLTTWFLTIYLMTTSKKALSSCEIARKVGICQKTAWYLGQKLRYALKEENNIVLSGIIEADETYVAPKITRDLRLKMRKKSHEEEQEAIHGLSDDKRRKLGMKMKHGRPKGLTKEAIEQKKKENSKKGERIAFEKPIVIFGMAERGGRIVMKKIGNASNAVSKDNIYPLLIKHCTRESTLMTDDLNLYNDTHHFFKAHFSICHKHKYVDGDVHTANIDNVWKYLKSMVRDVYHHVSYHHFDRYLDENVYRYNRRTESTKALFESFIPCTLDKITSNRKLTDREAIKLAA